MWEGVDVTLIWFWCVDPEGFRAVRRFSLSSGYFVFVDLNFLVWWGVVDELLVEGNVFDSRVVL